MIPRTSIRKAPSAANGVSYAFVVGEGKMLSLEWTSGTIGGSSSSPISELLQGRLPPAERTLVSRHLERALAGNESHIDMLWPLGSRSALHIRDLVTPEFDGGGRIVRVSGVLTPLSSVLSEASDDTQIWYRFIVESIDIGLSCWDSNDLLVLTNQRFRDLFIDLPIVLEPGLSLHEFISAIVISGFCAGDGRKDELSYELTDAIQSRRKQELHLSDGRLFQISPANVATGSLLAVNDLTVARSAEHALRTARAMAEKADLKKSRFLRAANHDLRQPLATLKILIYSSIDPKSEEHRQDLLHSMDVSVSIMEDILGSLLQIGQLDGGKVVPRETHFQLSQIFERMRIEFAPQAQAKDLRLRLIPSHVTIVSDRTLLERIISNYLANALRFTHAGTILIGARRRGAFVEIEVHDTGCGIPEEQLDLIFEEFYQVSDSRIRGKGLGLGLNIVHRLAEILQHPVRARSRLGRGSVFSVIVPVGNVWQSEISEQEVSERIGGEFRGMNVLVVDDDELLRSTMQQLLERWGASVRTIADGINAADWLSSDDWRPDIVIADYCLPHGQVGIDVIDAIRSKIDQEMPGVIVTADTDPLVIARIRDRNLPVLIKPINPPKLRSLMHHLLFEGGDGYSTRSD